MGTREDEGGSCEGWDQEKRPTEIQGNMTDGAG